VTDIRVRCARGGPGIQTEDGLRPGGYAIAVINAYATVDVASTQFEKNSIFNTVASFPGADELPAGEIRFRQSDKETRLEIRYANLIIEAQLLTGEQFRSR
jgi:hypothetical protein